MKLATYTPQIQRNTINAHVDAPAAQALANIGQMQGRSMQGIAVAINHASEQLDAVNVQAASNEYTKRLNNLLYNQDNGLMNTQMQGADGITAKFEEEEKKIRQEVGSQYKFLSQKGTMVFNNMTNNTANQRFELVRRHQTQQYQAYQNQTYDNAVLLNMQASADNYSMPEIVEQNMAEAIATTRMRYAGQGDEVLKAQERKTIGAIAQQVINRAYANGNDDIAGTYIEKYGKYMSPAELTQYSKAVHQRVVANMTRNTAESLVDRYGNNIGALYDAIYNRSEGGSGYDGSAAVAWMKEQVKNGVGWGRNTCTKGVNAALMAGGGIPGNVWAPTNWEDAKKAGTAFTDRSQLRTGDIVYWWNPKSDKNADDTSHVGIYDAETGMVYQSGTSGFKPIALDTYNVTGFARPQGQGMTAEQKDALYNSCVRQINQRKAIRNANNDVIFKDLDKGLMGLSDNGEANFATYTAMVDQMAGNDPEMRRKGYQYANYWWKRATNTDEEGNVLGRGGTGNNSGNSKGGLPIGAEYGLTQTLMHNNFESQADWAQYIVRFNPNKSEYNKLINMYEQKKRGAGVFAYDWDGMKDQFKLDNPDMDTQMINVAWRQAQQYATMQINNIREKEKREASYAEVMNFITDSMSKVNYGNYATDKWYGTSDVAYEPTKGELANAGIARTNRLPSGQIEVTYNNGMTEILTTEGLYYKLNPSNVSTDIYR